MLTSFGKMIRNIRINKGDLLYDMAKHLGVSSSYLSSVETGKTKVPDDWCKKISDIYGLKDEQYRKLVVESNK